MTMMLIGACITWSLISTIRLITNREAKAAALETKVVFEDTDEAEVVQPAKKGKKAKGGGSLFDMLDEGDIGEDDGGGGLLVSIRNRSSSAPF